MKMFIAKIVCHLLLFLITLFFYPLYAQENGWKFESPEEIERKKQLKHDSVMTVLKNKIGISVGFGPYGQTGFQKSDGSTPVLSIPNTMNQWQLIVAWHPFEQVSFDLKVDYRVLKDIPERPDLFSVIDGEEINVEGEGVGIIPISLGAKYYFMEDRFRPYIGLSAGVCKVISQFTEVSGNINDGINRIDTRFEENLNFIGLETGLDYRLGERFNVGISMQYQQSERFTQNIIGYDRLGGFSVTPRLSILLF